MVIKLNEDTLSHPMYSFKSVTPVYTGGGVYFFYGKCDEGNFIADDDKRFFSVTFLDLDVDTVNVDDLYDFEFIEDHEVELIDSIDNLRECKRFFLDMYRWIIKNRPNGSNCNYNLHDMKDRFERILSR